MFTDEICPRFDSSEVFAEKRFQQSTGALFLKKLQEDIACPSSGIVLPDLSLMSALPPLPMAGCNTELVTDDSSYQEDLPLQLPQMSGVSVKSQSVPMRELGSMVEVKQLKQ
ncbi:hypothetical protein J6590_071498 [Homalodisca vitripennis]|nr:hypothetical protein J6590_071498 [Homalodisca vitripennis]